MQTPILVLLKQLFESTPRLRVDITSLCNFYPSDLLVRNSLVVEGWLLLREIPFGHAENCEVMLSIEVQNSHEVVRSQF